MKRLWCLGLALIISQTAVLGEETAAGPATNVPELLPLAGYVGNWDVQFTIKFGNGESANQKGTAKAEWILEGRFVRQSWTVEGTERIPKLSGTTMMTYDSKRNAYRGWHYLSNGSVSESQGTWDEANKIMTWTVNDNGNSTTTKANFAEKDAENWTITVIDAGGKVAGEMSGKNTRKK